MRSLGETEVCKARALLDQASFLLTATTGPEVEVHPSVCSSSSLSAFRQDLAGQGERDRAPWPPSIPWPTAHREHTKGLAE